MRAVAMFSWLVIGAFIFLSPVQAANHHAHASAHEHADTHATSEGQHGPALIKPAPTGHWNAPAQEQKRTNPVAMSREGLQEASELFRENCAACHGSDGMGNGPLARDLEHQPANLFVMAPHHSDGDLRWKVAKGRGEMPGWEDVLSAEQIWMLVHYMKSLPAYHFVQKPNE